VILYAWDNSTSKFQCAALLKFGFYYPTTFHFGDSAPYASNFIFLFSAWLAMAYDKGLAQRVREILEEEPGFDEKKMFGGLCFLLFGNMVCGIIKEDLIVRVGADKYAQMLKMPHTRKFDITGKPLTGWVMVLSDAMDSDEELNNWIQRAVSFVRTLPPK
jgi:hypothetical protein